MCFIYDEEYAKWLEKQDVKLTLALRELELYRRLVSGLPDLPVVPLPWPGLRCLTTNPQEALALSRNIDEAIEKSGVQLGKDETFVAIMYVAKRPEYISEVIPYAQSGSGVPCANLILEPVILEQVMKVRERDRIKYGDDKPKGE